MASILGTEALSCTVIHKQLPVTCGGLSVFFISLYPEAAAGQRGAAVYTLLGGRYRCVWVACEPSILCCGCVNLMLASDHAGTAWHLCTAQGPAPPQLTW